MRVYKADNMDEAGCFYKRMKRFAEEGEFIADLKHLGGSCKRQIIFYSTVGDVDVIIHNLCDGQKNGVDLLQIDGRDSERDVEGIVRKLERLSGIKLKSVGGLALT